MSFQLVRFLQAFHETKWDLVRVQRHRRVITFFFAIFSLFIGISEMPAATPWHDAFYPYRVSITLESPASDRTAIDLTPGQVVNALRSVCIDALSEETLAMDKCILVDPAADKTVGRFELVAAGEPLNIDGKFQTWASGTASSPWSAMPEHVKLEQVDVEGSAFTAIRATGERLEGRRVNQMVKLTPGQPYLLEYWINNEATDGTIGILLYDPSKRLFGDLHRSYVSPVPPIGKWVQRRVLYVPEVTDVEIGIAVGFAGTGAIGDIRLTPVKWQLIADLKEETSSLDLYAIVTAGHRLTAPALSASAPCERSVKVSNVAAEGNNLNPEGVLLDLGDGVEAWTIPSYLPLRSETLGLTRPRGGSPRKGIRMSLLRGTAATVLVAIDTKTPVARIFDAACDVPVKVDFTRLAPIPVYDSFFPEGKRFETRLDAMVPLDFQLLPPSDNGIHVVALTLRAPNDAKEGVSSGKIVLSVETQEPVIKKIEVPIELRIVPAMVKPMRHFGTISGTAQFTAKYDSPKAGFAKDNITVAEFHGIRGEKMGDDWISRLSTPDRYEPHKAPIRELARKYTLRTMDFDIVPAHLTFLAQYSYDLVDQGEGKRPRLENWNFTEYDKAIDEFVIERDAPWLVVWHTGGDLMQFHEYGDGTYYSFNPDAVPGKPVKLVSREEYIKLLGDYFEPIAAHLHEKGVLDRAVIVIDESPAETFDFIVDAVAELRSRPYAKHLKIANTTHTVSSFTRTLPNGELLMSDVLDMPMPQQDEHFNYFEPDLARKFKRPGMLSWVYYVQTDRMNIHNAGLSTVLTPLQMREYGVKGWYLWAMTIWSMPYKNLHLMGTEYSHGPTVNPWLNPYYHHGHGMLCFFYPPDPRGPVNEPTDLIIPSYRLALMRDGIDAFAVLDVAEKGVDDGGNKISVDSEKLAGAKDALSRLWPDNPVQWYLSYDSYHTAQKLLDESFK